MDGKPPSPILSRRTNASACADTVVCLLVLDWGRESGAEAGCYRWLWPLGGRGMPERWAGWPHGGRLGAGGGHPNQCQMVRPMASDSVALRCAASDTITSGNRSSGMSSQSKARWTAVVMLSR